MEINREATDKVFRGLKVRSKVRMNYFKVKTIGACYV